MFCGSPRAAGRRWRRCRSTAGSAPGRPRGRGRFVAVALGRALALILRDFDERQDVGVDDAERRLRAQLAAQQAHRFLVGVDVFAAASDEADDEHALKRRDVELGLDRRLDRNLVVVGTQHGQCGDRRDGDGERQAATAANATLLVLLSGPIIDFLEELVVLANLRIVRIDLERFLVGLARLVELPFVFVADGEVVEGGDVVRVDLGRPFPSGRWLRARGRAARR